MKNSLLGFVGGGLLGVVIAFGGVAVVMSSDRNAVVYALSTAVIVAPMAGVLGAIAGALASRWTPLKIAALCGGLGLGAGSVVTVALVSMAAGNWVMGLLAMGTGAIGGASVGAGVAKWRRPQPG